MLGQSWKSLTFSSLLFFGKTYRKWVTLDSSDLTLLPLPAFFPSSLALFYKNQDRVQTNAHPPSISAQSKTRLWRLRLCKGDLTKHPNPQTVSSACRQHVPALKRRQEELDTHLWHSEAKRSICNITLP